jgi:hypothetical protein
MANNVTRATVTRRTLNDRDLACIIISKPSSFKLPMVGVAVTAHTGD